MVRFHPARVAVLRVLVADPDAEWTVAALTRAANLNTARQSSVRELILTLMNERLLEAVPYQRALTTRLRVGAEKSVLLQLNRWQQRNSNIAQPQVREDHSDEDH
jgi:hypothetical protein